MKAKVNVEIPDGWFRLKLGSEVKHNDRIFRPNIDEIERSSEWERLSSGEPKVTKGEIIIRKQPGWIAQAKAATEYEQRAKKMAEFQKSVEEIVLEIIRREKRPGGLLNKR